MNSLLEIIEWKKNEIKTLPIARGLEETIKSGRHCRLHDLESVLQEPGMQVIAELKRRSPSEGEIVQGLDLIEIALQYERAGAAAISVLTDQKYFGGSMQDLKAVKAAVDIPILCKDFIIDERQIEAAYLAGADAILLISDALPLQRLQALHAYCEALGMGALVEIHDLQNLNKIQEIQPEIVGFNARDLTTMLTNISDFESAIESLPRSARVAESGIHSPSDLAWIASLGYEAALIGTTLLKAANPAGLLAEMLEEARDQ